MRRFAEWRILIVLSLGVVQGCASLTYSHYYVPKDHQGWEQEELDSRFMGGSHLPKPPWYWYTYGSGDNTLKTTLAPYRFNIAYGIIIPVIPLINEDNYETIILINKGDALKDPSNCLRMNPRLLVFDNTLIYPKTMGWQNDNTCAYGFDRQSVMKKGKSFKLFYDSIFDNGVVPPLDLKVKGQLNLII